MLAAMAQGALAKRMLKNIATWKEEDWVTIIDYTIVTINAVYW